MYVKNSLIFLMLSISLQANATCNTTQASSFPSCPQQVAAFNDMRSRFCFGCTLLDESDCYGGNIVTISAFCVCPLIDFYNNSAEFFQPSCVPNTSPSPSPSPSPTPPQIGFGNVQVTQAVPNFGFVGGVPGSFNCDGSLACLINLVKGKSTVVQVDLQTNGPSVSATLTATLNDSSGTKSVSMGVSAGPTVQTFTLPSFIPENSGMGSITIAITGTENPPPSKKLNIGVKETNPLNLVYFPMSYLKDFGGTSLKVTVPPDDFSSHVKNSDLLMQGMFPISEDGLKSKIGDNIVGSKGTSPSTVDVDLAAVGLRATKVNPLNQSGIAVVPESYFSDHGLPAVKGAAQNPSGLFVPSGVIVTSTFWNVTPHEIGHTFGLAHTSFVSNSVKGYWVNQRTPLSNAIDLMNFDEALQKLLFEAWISPLEYGRIFGRLLSNPEDPEVIVVSGLSNKDGSVDLQPLVFLSNGNVTAYSPTSDGIVKTVDSNGATIAQVSFYTSFEIITDTGDEIPTNASPFLVQIPLSQGPSTLEIVTNGKKVAHFDPNAQLLIDAVREISDSSFMGRADNERDALLIKARRIEHNLEKCRGVNNDDWKSDQVECLSEVVHKIIELREKINRVLNDSLVTSDELQLTKQGVFKIVDAVTLQLIPSPVRFAKKHTFRIRILPETSGRQERLFTTLSVTQGSNGSVCIDRDGEVSYNPYSGLDLADSFTVTVKDIEGDSVVKTVTIIPPKGHLED